MVPKAEWFQSEFVDALVKGQKPGAGFRTKVLAQYPALEDKITNTSTQTAVKEAIKTLGDTLPDEDKEERFIALPTGGGFSVSAILPEPIYIPAVKDLRDETKTAETSPFGKILSIVMDWIEPQLGDAKKLFRELTKNLTRKACLDQQAQLNVPKTKLPATIWCKQKMRRAEVFPSAVAERLS